MHVLYRLLLAAAKWKLLTYSADALSSRIPRGVSPLHRAGFFLWMARPRQAFLTCLILHTARFLCRLIARYSRS